MAIAGESAALVMFAIRSAIKLAQQSRAAYVDATRARALTLPLPDFNPQPDVGSALSYFVVAPGKTHIDAQPRIQELVATRPRTPEQDEELMTFYDECLLLDLGGQKGASARDGSLFDAAQLNALVTVRQWRRGADPHPSVLHRFAGTFIELGIDYLTTVPGALNPVSGHSKVAMTFLRSLEDVDFAETPLGDWPARAFAAALQTVGTHAELFSSDPKVQALVGVTTRALTETVAARIKAMRTAGGPNLSLEERLTEWAEAIFRSVLTSGGRMVLADPKGFFGFSDDAQGALVSEVGQAVLSLVLDQHPGQLERVFSGQSIDTVVRAALKVVGEHPELVRGVGNAGLQKLMAGVAQELGGYEAVVTTGMLPELTRIILEKTGENLPLIWSDAAQDPKKHLLLSAASATLDRLTAKPGPGARWTLTFDRDDLLGIADIALDEVVQNPGWLVTAPGGLSPNLAAALRAVMGVLRARGDQRLSTGTAALVVQSALRAVSLRAGFLDKLPPDVAMAGQPVVAAILDGVLATVFDPGLDPKAAWSLVRSEVVAGAVRIGFAELARVEISPKAVRTFQLFMQAQPALIAAGKPWDLGLFEASLRGALASAVATPG
jgi:hypothetical protein